MDQQVLQAIAIPFLGTVLGALTGFAAGVMTAASVWSLLIPAMDHAAALGRWAFFPAAAGFWLGIGGMLALDRLVPHLHQDGGGPEGPRSPLGRTALLVLAVTVHNIPEGMAVGVVLAGWLWPSPWASPCRTSPRAR